jgi:hypothetical protein
MRSTTAIRSARSGLIPEGFGAPRLRLRVLLHRSGIDRKLAAGTMPAAAPELLLRSCQLTRRQERRCLSRCLEKIVEEAEGVTQPSPFSLAIPIHREAVSIWRDSMLAIARRLDRQAPVAAAGMARLRLFLTDGAGPLFNPTSDYLLGDVLPRIEEDL